MPELPEVEVLRRHLAPQLVGRRVVRVEVPCLRLVRPGTPAALSQAMEGAEIMEVDRRGKFLLFRLRSGGGGEVQTVGHLGMTGRMYVDDGSGPVPRHAAVLVWMDRGRWIFEDARQFGRFHVGSSGLEVLGPEPLGPEWTAEDLARRLGRSRQPIKVKLMDQSVVAGVGNIYASEALHEARIDPRRAAGRLRPGERERLRVSVRRVLARAIEDGMGAALDFAGGRDGLFYFGSSEGAPAHAERLQVYDREGQPCRRCGRAIRRIVQAGRSTYFCPGCIGTNGTGCAMDRGSE